MWKHIPHYIWILGGLVAVMVILLAGNYRAVAQSGDGGSGLTIHKFRDDQTGRCFSAFIFSAGSWTREPRHIQVVEESCDALEQRQGLQGSPEGI